MNVSGLTVEQNMREQLLTCVVSFCSVVGGDCLLISIPAFCKSLETDGRKSLETDGQMGINLLKQMGTNHLKQMGTNDLKQKGTNDLKQMGRWAQIT